MSGTSTPAASSPCAVAAFIGDREVAEAALLACPDSDLVRAMPPLRRALAQSPGDGSLSSDVLDSVASLLLIPDLTVSLALGLRPVLLDVTARALADPRVGPEDRLIAMAKILAIAPHAWPLLISHWQRSVCPLSRQRQGVPILPEETCLKVTAAVQTVLTLGPPGTALALEDAWDFSVFADFASSIIGEEQEGDQGSIQLELRARSREILSILLHVFDEMACVYAAIPAGQAMCLSDVEMRQLRLKSLAPKGLQGLISDKHSAMLHPAVHVLGGILHCRCTPAIDGNIGSQKLVMCESTSANVASLSRALAAGGPVLVCGPPGCGKSAILRETARAALGGKESSLLELHLDDTTDSKTLLGAHVCTEVPGEFVWQPGPLAQALAGGRWVLIEDVDRAPPEVLAALVPLMEGKPLVVSGRPHPLTASPGFQLLGTVSSADSYLPATSQPPRIGGAADFGALWSRVQFQSLSETELLGVARGIHHQLSQRAVEALLATFRLCGGRMPGSDATDEEKHSSSGRIRRWIGTRTPSVRDFLKLVARVSASGMKVGEGREGSILCTAKQGELILLEALDVFAGHLPDQQDAAQAARRAAHTWGLREETAHALVTTRMPEMISDGDRRLIGRVVMRLPGVVDGVSAQPNPGSFAKTGLALRLMERLAACVEMGEPALLVGETGCGKTTIVQQLANHVGATLIVQNLSLQTDNTDLLGGFRPVDMRVIAEGLLEEFYELFNRSFPGSSANSKFAAKIASSFEKRDWKKLGRGLENTVDTAMKKFAQEAAEGGNSGGGKAARRSDSPGSDRQSWEVFGDKVARFERQREAVDHAFAFSFVEGVLVKALKAGHWVLLDEINLAAAETLQRLVGLLEGSQGSLCIMERGDDTPVTRHPNFRIFAAMNPPTDTSKRDLPPALRSRFTEIYVSEPKDKQDLRMIACASLGSAAETSADTADGGGLPAKCVDLYESCRKRARDLEDGAGQHPHYSLRSLCRALRAASNLVRTKKFNLKRALYEGFCSSFATQLTPAGAKTIQDRVLKAFFGSAKKGASQDLDHPPPRPGKRAEDWELVDPFWLGAGPLPRVDWAKVGSDESSPQFIVTPSVQQSLRHLARAVAVSDAPVLLQGPTSAGKTTLVEYLATRCGHRCVRINNHEHTDLQEYLGIYTTDGNGKLAFHEGVLVEAVRNGYWIILDELNLAPSDVLEALNRLLDDNRELFIPETQEVVHPHSRFRLFATQNPPGVYGGRKYLSRAFRNRFLEINIGDIPTHEWEVIISRRCALPPSHATLLVGVMSDLQRLRQASDVFKGKDSFASPRDLLRWASRHPESKQALAEEGYMLLGERLRDDAEKKIVLSVLEDRFGAKIDTEQLYGSDVEAAIAHAKLGSSLSGIAPTRSLGRLLKLVSRCVEYREPVLLVGETGSGKTTVCQLLSAILQKDLRMVNCHQSTEAADLLGSLRPLRGRAALASQLSRLSREFIATCNSVTDSKPATTLEDAWAQAVAALATGAAQGDTGGSKRKRESDEAQASTFLSQLKEKRKEIEALTVQCASLFDWEDGPLVKAMKSGEMLLLDELSLAEDAVLERLNSVLEPKRTLVLAEKGGGSASEVLTASEGFALMATMNPGGDYGKRELSPALRSRFTEIWVPPARELDELTSIVSRTMEREGARIGEDVLQVLLNVVSSSVGDSLGTRDLLSWAQFVARSVTCSVPAWSAFAHGASMVLLDGLGLGRGLSAAEIFTLREKVVGQIAEYVPKLERAAVAKEMLEQDVPSIARCGDDQFGCGSFTCTVGPHREASGGSTFSLSAPTTARNARRVLRAMQLEKAILLEGSPGVGKTGLITALAAAAGHPLVRINLSEQTDLADLIGSDLPVPDDVEGADGAAFAWCDGIFLKALKAGKWVLLDEMNLASQTVLEGLNACLDHRAEVFIPELGKSFHCPPSFRVFAAQNPLGQGGGRKGMPKSLLNRFTKVVVEPLSPQDMLHIAKHRFPSMRDNDLLLGMIRFNSLLQEDTMTAHTYGRSGSPWEFNLRDVFRWCELYERLGVKIARLEDIACEPFIDILYFQRFRTADDQGAALERAVEVFGDIRANMAELAHPFYRLTRSSVHIGKLVLPRQWAYGAPGVGRLPLGLRRPLQAVAYCVAMQWPCMLVGPRSSGKSTVVDHLASVIGVRLVTIALTPASDISELLGGFEQVDAGADIQTLVDKSLALSLDVCRFALAEAPSLSAADVWSSRRALLRSTGKNTVVAVAGLLDSVVDLLRLSDCAEGWAKQPLSQANVLKAALNESCARQEAGRFRWVDGPLVSALQQGAWLLLENANLCSSSVLDRLNPLLEPGGQLFVPESGTSERCIDIHPNFRIFLAMDPSCGEVSRAMRNRCVEISLEGCGNPSRIAQIFDPVPIYSLPPAVILDCVHLLLEKGVVSGPNVTSLLQQWSNAPSHDNSFRHLVRMVEVQLEDRRRGTPWSEPQFLEGDEGASVLMVEPAPPLRDSGRQTVCAEAALVEMLAVFARTKLPPALLQIIAQVGHQGSTQPLLLLPDGELALISPTASPLPYAIAQFCRRLCPADSRLRRLYPVSAYQHKAAHLLNDMAVFMIETIQAHTGRALQAVDLERQLWLPLDPRVDSVGGRSGLSTAAANRLRGVDVLFLDRLPLLWWERCVQERPLEGIAADQDERLARQLIAPHLPPWMSTVDALVLEAARDGCSDDVLLVLTEMLTARDDLSLLVTPWLYGREHNFPWDAFMICWRGADIAGAAFVALPDLSGVPERDTLLGLGRRVALALERRCGAQWSTVDLVASGIWRPAVPWKGTDALRLHRLQALADSLAATTDTVRSDQRLAAPSIPQELRREVLEAIATLHGATTPECALAADMFSGDVHSDGQLRGRAVFAELLDRMEASVECSQTDISRALRRWAGVDDVDDGDHGAFDQEEQVVMRTIGNEGEASMILTAQAQLQIAPLAQHWALAEEAALLTEMGGFTGSGNWHVRLKRLLSLHTRWALTSPADIRPHQTLTWLLEIQEGGAQVGELEKLIPLIRESMLRRLWTSLINGLDSIGPALAPPNARVQWSGHDLGRHEHLKGPPRSQQLIRSVVMMRLCRSTIFGGPAVAPDAHGSVTVLNRGVRLKQLQHASEVLLRYPYPHVEPSLAYRTMAWVAIREAVAILEPLFISAADFSIASSILGMLIEGKECTHDCYGQLIHALLHLQEHGHFGALITEQLVPAIAVLYEGCGTPASVGEALALCGAMLYALRVPIDPVDPLRRPALEAMLLKNRLKGAELDLATRVGSTLLLRGSGTSGAVDLEIQVSKLSANVKDLDKKAAERPDTAGSFAELYRVLHGFMKGLGSFSRVRELLDRLRGDPQGIEEEASWHEASSAFTKSLRSRFPFHSDVTLPAIDAIMMMRTGLRLVSATGKEDAAAQRALLLTLQVPWACGASSSASCGIPDLDQVALSLDSSALGRLGQGAAGKHQQRQQAAFLQAMLRKLEIQVNCGAVTGDRGLALIYEGLSAVVVAWREHREKEDQKKKDAESLIQYKAQDHEVEAEEELERKALKQYFPDYSLSFEVKTPEEMELDSGQEELGDGSGGEAALEDSLSRLMSEQETAMTLLHRRIHIARAQRHCLLSGDPSALQLHLSGVSDADRWDSFKECYRAASLFDRSILEQQLGSPATENALGASHLLALAASARICTSGAELFPDVIGGASEHAVTDFYHSHAPGEVMLVATPLAHLLARIVELLEQFPGNALLIATASCADRLRRAPIHMPVAAALAGVQVILARAQAWEEVAHKGVSMSSELAALSSLVVRWRRLELQSWQLLLQQREVAAGRRAHSWWPWLHRLITGTSNSDQDPAAGEEGAAPADHFCLNWPDLDGRCPGWLWEGFKGVIRKSAPLKSGAALSSSVVDALDAFLRTSSMGEYPERLELVRSFAAHCAELGEWGRHEILLNLWRYYDQFSSEITAAREKLKAPIAKSLREEARLGKWDEQTYYSLAESAQRTHRKLLKFLKSYDDVLQSSVALELQKNYSQGIGDNLLTGLPSTEVPPPKTIFDTVVSVEGEEELAAGHEGGSVRMVQPVLPQPLGKLSPASVDGFPEVPLLARLPTLTKRTHKLLVNKLRNDRDALRGMEAAELSEDLCLAIFGRIQSLRLAPPGKAIKKRAVLDLLRGLKGQGLHTDAFAVPAESRQIYTGMSLPSPFSWETLLLPWGQSMPGACKVKASPIWLRAERYYFRSMCEISRFRLETSAAISSDISRQEVGHMLGYAEHLNLMLLQQRSVIFAAHAALRSFRSAVHLVAPFAGQDGQPGENLPADQAQLERKAAAQRQSLLTAIEGVSELLLVARGAEKAELGASYAVREAMEAVKESLVSSLQALKCYAEQGLVSRNLADAMEKNSVRMAKISVDLRYLETNCLEGGGFPGHALRAISVLLEEGAAEEPPCSPGGTGQGVDPAQCMHDVAESLLVAIQSVLTPSDRPALEDEKVESGEVPAETLSSAHASVLVQTRGMCQGLSRARAKADDLLCSIKEHEEKDSLRSANLATAAAALFNLIHEVDSAVEAAFEGLLTMHKGFAKLQYVLLRVFRTLLSKGLCSDKVADSEEGEGEGGDGQPFQEADGTGMGSGEGMNDVSEQIEDEEQLLGLQGEDDGVPEEQRELSKEEAEKGVEMANDFEGEMFDVPEEPDGEAKESDKEDEEEELEREMGDVGDGDVVDERLWGDDDEEDDEEGEGEEAGEEYESGNRLDGAKLEDELRTKETDDGEEPKQSNDEKSAGADVSREDEEEDGGGDEEGDENGIGEEDGHEEDQDEGGEASGGQVKQEKDEGASEAEEDGGSDGDLPNDLKLDNGQDGQGSDDHVSEGDGDEQESEAADEIDAESDIAAGENEALTGDEEDSPEAGAEAEAEVGAQPHGETLPEDIHGDAGSGLLGGKATPEAVAADEADADAEDDVEAEALDDVKEEDEGANGGQDEGGADEGGAGGADPSNGGADDGPWRSGGAKGGEAPPDQSLRSPEAPNPLRVPGDAMKHWHRRLEILSGQETTEAAEAPPVSNEKDASGAGLHMYAQDEEDDSAAQALGPADEEDAAALDESIKAEISEELRQPEEEPEGHGSTPPDAGKAEAEAAPSQDASKEKRGRKRPKDTSGQQHSAGQQPPLPESPEDAKLPSDDMDVLEERDEAKDGEASEDSPAALPPKEALIVTDMAVCSDDEAEAEDALQEGDPGTTSLQARNSNAELWQTLIASTNPLSTRLCERLRLVLTAQVASRLQGDYRSGKRINMRRVIGYIASHFRRDKIWLKRTKPARRDYQILIAIDNTQSMKNVGESAIAAVATVTAALSQLEVGELGVASFGKSVCMLHDIGEPWTLESGMNVVEGFSFDESESNMSSSVRQMREVMLGARGGSSVACAGHGSSIPQQLVIIISDGFHEHGQRAGIRRCVLDMAEKGALFLQIIVDKGGVDSIYEVKHLVTDSKGGKFALVPYLQDYPFPFYFILQDIAQLPEALASALTQWFEAVAATV